MNTDEIIKLNRDRVSHQLYKVTSHIKPDDKDIMNKATITHNNKVIKLQDIDFTKSCLFITSHELLGIIGMYGLQRLNNVHPKDSTPTARYSTIHTKYMIVNSQEALYSKLPMDLIEVIEEYNPISYLTYDLVLWRLFKDKGIGDNNTMFRVVNSIIEERRATNKMDWLFFVGKPEDLPHEYEVQDYETYIITSPISKVRETKGGTLF